MLELAKGVEPATEKELTSVVKPDSRDESVTGEGADGVEKSSTMAERGFGFVSAIAKSEFFLARIPRQPSAAAAMTASAATTQASTATLTTGVLYPTPLSWTSKNRAAAEGLVDDPGCEFRLLLSDYISVFLRWASVALQRVGERTTSTNSSIAWFRG